MRLHIPRNFHGPILVTYRHGSLRFSDAINRNLTLFGEVDNTRHCFLGDFSQWTEGGEEWTGDELVADVKHGNVKIHYDDDAVGSPVKTRPTLLNRIFGFWPICFDIHFRICVFSTCILDCCDLCTFLRSLIRCLGQCRLFNERSCSGGYYFYRLSLVSLASSTNTNDHIATKSKGLPEFLTTVIYIWTDVYILALLPLCPLLGHLTVLKVGTRRGTVNCS